MRGVLRRASRLGSCGASSRDRRSSAVASDHLLALPCGLLTLRFITADAALHVVGDVGEMPFHQSDLSSGREPCLTRAHLISRNQKLGKHVAVRTPSVLCRRMHSRVNRIHSAKIKRSWTARAWTAPGGSSACALSMSSADRIAAISAERQN